MVHSTALFDRNHEAHRVVDALEDEGFETIEIDDESTRIAGADTLTADDLAELGVAGREAARYADAIRDGASLVVVSCGRERLGELRPIFARFDRYAPADVPDSDHLRFRRDEFEEAASEDPIDETGPHRDDNVREGHRRADSERMVGHDRDSGDATGLSRRAHGDADPDESAEAPGATDSEASRTAPGGMPDRFEESFRRHYEHYYGDNGLPYAEYARAYHYGVVLAEHAGFRDRAWDEIEEFARQGWDSQTHGHWPRVREAVRYGWETIRGRNLFTDPGRHL